MTETTHSPKPSSPQSISRDDIKFFETPVIEPQTQVSSKPALTQADDEFSKLFSVWNNFYVYIPRNIIYNVIFYSTKCNYE